MRGHFITSGLRKLNAHYQSGGERLSNETLYDILYSIPLAMYNQGKSVQDINDRIVELLTAGKVYWDDDMSAGRWDMTGAGFVKTGTPDISMANTYEFIVQTLSGVENRATMDSPVIITANANTLTVKIHWFLLKYLGDWDGDYYNTSVTDEITVADRFTASPTFTDSNGFYKIKYWDTQYTGEGIKSPIDTVLVNHLDYLRVKVGYNA